MLLGKKHKSPTDRKRYVIDYSDWLDTGETLATVTYEVDVGTATVDGDALAGDNLSAIFFINGGEIDTPFSVIVTATTSVGQVKNDHIEFVVVAP